MNYIEDKDPKNLQIFVGATTAMIPFNSILQHDQTMDEKNWGVKGRLRMKRYDSVLDFLLMLGGTISQNGQLLLPKLQRVFQYEENCQKLDQLMGILKSICTRAHQERQDVHCSVNTAKQIQLLIEHPGAVATALAGDAVLDVAAVNTDGNFEIDHNVKAEIREAKLHKAVISKYGVWITKD